MTNKNLCNNDCCKILISDKYSVPVEDKSFNITIPQVHDHKLIKHGCKHAEGSPKIEKENLIAAFDAALDLGDDLAEHVIICYRNKDKNGWNFGCGVMPLSNLKPGNEIVLNLPNLKKLVIE